MTWCFGPAVIHRAFSKGLKAIMNTFSRTCAYILIMQTPLTIIDHDHTWLAIAAYVVGIFACFTLAVD